ncbi:MAG: hypothetical protein RSD54_05185, partial [Ruthenibacterium sp.]
HRKLVCGWRTIERQNDRRNKRAIQKQTCTASLLLFVRTFSLVRICVVILLSEFFGKMDNKGV